MCTVPCAVSVKDRRGRGKGSGGAGVASDVSLCKLGSGRYLECSGSLTIYNYHPEFTEKVQGAQGGLGACAEGVRMMGKAIVRGDLGDIVLFLETPPLLNPRFCF